MYILYDPFLAKEWFWAHRALGLWPHWQEYFSIRSAYLSPNRFYHTWKHIYDTCSFVRTHYGFQPLLILALFYHDVVYDVKRKDNEEASANLWMAYAKRRGVDRLKKAPEAQIISDMIVMTAKHKIEEDQSDLFKMMSDADMSTFLSSKEEYLEYARNIWREYHTFGREGFILGRLQFLNTVHPESLFYTPEALALMDNVCTNLEGERKILETEPERILVPVDKSILI